MRDKITIEIPIPKFAIPKFAMPKPAMPTKAKQLGNRLLKEGVLLLISSTLLVVFSIFTINYHVSELRWIDGDPNLMHTINHGLEVVFGSEVRKIQMLPQRLYTSPHHQLAISAGCICILTCVSISILYPFARRTKRAFTTRFFLGFMLVSTIILTTTALLYNFILTATSPNVDGWTLHEYSSPDKYYSYGAAWMDLETWTCGVRKWVRGTTIHQQGARPYLDSICEKATKGRQMLVPMLVLLLITAGMSWVSFNDLLRKDGYEKVEDLDEDGSKEAEEEEPLLTYDAEENSPEREEFSGPRGQIREV